ncbi:MAG: hypothetical protein VB100_04075 [Angelakisella sp.]|nr:hypothetical protein [Angelakisella sp.]
MIKLIVGNKGSGKTKTLIARCNEAVSVSQGNVICLEKGLKLTYDITHKARLVDTDEYEIQGFDALYGFLAGLMAGNYDTTHIFVDATLKIGGRDYEAFALMVDKLLKLSSVANVEITFTVSCDPSELPERLRGFIA